MRVRGWALSDVGRKRDHNEDSFVCSDEIGLYLVADGMGGHLGGERASRIVSETLESEIGKARSEGRLAAGSAPSASGAADPIGEILRTATQQADTIIYDAAKANEDLAGMGTTLTAALFHGGRLHVCHVGDSRVFQYRNGYARQVTEDHSLIQEQVRAGLISAAEAKESRFRNVITRSVGYEPSVNPDILSIALQAGDCYMLCSDGLSNYLSTEEIGQVLTAHYYCRAPRVFVDTANERGGDDNITCIVVYVANDT